MDQSYTAAQESTAEAMRLKALTSQLEALLEEARAGAEAGLLEQSERMQRVHAEELEQYRQAHADELERMRQAHAEELLSASEKAQDLNASQQKVADLQV